LVNFIVVSSLGPVSCLQRCHDFQLRHTHVNFYYSYNYY